MRLCVFSLPAWYEVRAVDEPEEMIFPVALHRAEHQAILLAEKIRPDVILIDEQIGRTIASARNLPVSGTLGILERADIMRFINDFPKILKQLKTSGFYVGESLEQRLLQRHRNRQETK